jgi:taurine dioxygenase
MKLTLTALPGSGFGAEVDISLAAAADAELPGVLTAALHHHRVLVFRNQHLNHGDLLATSRLFGPVDTDVDRRYAVGGFPGVTVISNIAENGAYVGTYDGDNEEEWHADNSFKPDLSLATLLYSVITPAEGGQTRFADATRAYADLPDDMKARIVGLNAVHSIHQLGLRQSQAAGGRSSVAAGTFADRSEVIHPLVPTHPVTGARSLLLGSMVITEVVGLGAPDSAPLLADLLVHATGPRYVYSHQWRQGDLVIWDNRAVLHTASPCDSSHHRRLLYRTAIAAAPNRHAVGASRRR